MGKGDRVLSQLPQGKLTRLALGKDLELYAPMQIINSKWIKEIQHMNSVHSNYNQENWKNTKHYFLDFTMKLLNVLQNLTKLKYIKLALKKC